MKDRRDSVVAWAISLSVGSAIFFRMLFTMNVSFDPFWHHIDFGQPMAWVGCLMVSVILSGGYMFWSWILWQAWRIAGGDRSKPDPLYVRMAYESLRAGERTVVVNGEAYRPDHPEYWKAVCWCSIALAREMESERAGRSELK